jgi:hypothetical protein
VKTGFVFGLALAVSVALSASAADPNWKVIPGHARDIGVGSQGDVWIIGAGKEKGGFEIRRWNGKAWSKIPGGAVRVAGGRWGSAWVVDDKQAIYVYHDSKWIRKSGKAREIGADAKGNLWIIGTDKVAGGYAIYKHFVLRQEHWIKMPGAGGMRIAVDPKGNAWIVDDKGGIRRHDGKGWKRLPGKATDIAVGADGTVWIVGADAVEGGFRVAKWTGKAWARQPGALTNIAVDHKGFPWGIDADGNILADKRTVAGKKSSTRPRPTPGINLAKGKEAVQSSTHSGGDAARAVDGNTNGAWNRKSVSHTGKMDGPWWRVDLGAVYKIQSIRIHNRTDSHGGRLNGAVVMVSDWPFTSDSLTTAMGDGISRYILEKAEAVNRIDAKRSGRYVMVRIPRKEQLHLAEVVVFGEKKPVRPTTPKRLPKPFKWVAAASGKVPPGAIAGGHSNGRTQFVCRAKYRGGVHPGRVVPKSPVQIDARNCVIGWGDKQVQVGRYEVLTGDPLYANWKDGSRGRHPAGAYVGGKEGGRNLIVCRFQHSTPWANHGRHIGKAFNRFCHIGWGGREATHVTYEVLVLSQFR